MFDMYHRDYMGHLSRLTTYFEYFALTVPAALPGNVYTANDDILQARRVELPGRKEWSARVDYSNEEKIERWLSGKSNSLPRMGYNEPVLIRYRAKKERFETSKGVEVPIEAARRFARAYVAGAVGTGTKVLNFTVDSVDYDTIKIGCHTIKRDLINELIGGASLKVICFSTQI
jgi:hypothetical protein